MSKTVYTGGTFDLPHAGHVRFLRQCAELGEVVVSLNTDEFITAYKGRPPVMSFDERAEIIAEFASVAGVIPNTGGHDSRPAIDEVQPNIVAIGSDWAVRDYHAQMGFDQAWLDARNIWLLYIPYTVGVSTTAIRARLAADVL
jgi:cytidyltransferase-like protein